MLCKRISNILNDRPVSVQRTRSQGQHGDFLRPLSPKGCSLGVILVDLHQNTKLLMTLKSEDPSSINLMQPGGTNARYNASMY